jgi:C1A family cysteine protease
MVAYSSLFSEEVRTSGILTMPSETDTYEGGHAVMLVGYDLHAGTFLVRNSWGKEWGQDGYFTIPLHYVLDPSLAFDFWTVDSLQT